MIEYEGFKCEFLLSQGSKLTVFVNDRFEDIDKEEEWTFIKDCLGRCHSLKNDYIIYSAIDTDKTKMILAEMKI